MIMKIIFLNFFDIYHKDYYIIVFECKKNINVTFAWKKPISLWLLLVAISFVGLVSIYGCVLINSI